MKQIDHIIIRVDHLSEAIRDFHNMGFNVYYGNGKENCHHAMIYFKDGSFIEFIDPSRFPGVLRLLAKTRVLNWFGAFFKRIGFYAVSGQRYLDYSIYEPDLENFYNKTKEQNRVSKLFHLSRLNHSGDKVTWKLFVYNDSELPFVMSDYTPKKYPVSHAAEHPNHISGLKRLVIASASPERLLNTWQDVFGLPVSGNHIQLKHTELLIEQGAAFKIKSLSFQKPTTVGEFDFSKLKAYDLLLEN